MRRPLGSAAYLAKPSFQPAKENNHNHNNCCFKLLFGFFVYQFPEGDKGILRLNLSE